MNRQFETELNIEVCVDRPSDEWDEASLTVVWNVYGRYVRGRQFGPPEDCYPDEHPEYEIDTIYLDTDFGRFHINEDEVLYSDGSLRHKRLPGSYENCELGCKRCAFTAAERAADVLRQDRWAVEEEARELNEEDDYDHAN